MKVRILFLSLILCCVFSYADAQTTFSIMGKKAYISGNPKNIRIYCPPPYNKACFTVRTNVLENEDQDPTGTSVEVEVYGEEERVVARYSGILREMENRNSDAGNYVTLFCEECE